LGRATRARVRDRTTLHVLSDESETETGTDPHPYSLSPNPWAGRGRGNVRPEEAVGRILFPGGRRPFLSTSRHREAPAAYPGASSATADGGDGRPSTPLFGLAPHGVYRALSVSGEAVRSYRTLSPLPPVGSEGGLLSVALSLALPRPGVTRHAARLESGPSSAPARAQRTPASSSRTLQL